MRLPLSTPARRALAAALIVAVALTRTAVTGEAAVVSEPITYSGSAENSDRRPLFDTGVVFVSGCANQAADPTTCALDFFPGSVWFRIEGGVRNTVVTSQPATLTLEGGDARQDARGTLTTRLVPSDGDGKEVTLRVTPYVNVDIAYDERPAECPRSQFTSGTELRAATAGGCVSHVRHTGDIDLGSLPILRQDGRLPYSGSLELSETVLGPSIFDIGALVGVPGVLTVNLNFETRLTLTAVDGYRAEHAISVGGGTPRTLLSGPIRWTSTGDVAEGFGVPCTAAAGAPLTVTLTNQRWGGTGVAATALRVGVNLAGLAEIFGLDLATREIFSGPVEARSANLSRTIGQVLAENQAPTVSPGGGYSGNEGAPIALTAVGTGPGGGFDNCDPGGGSLSYTWTFDDGTSATGRSVTKRFADNVPTPHSGTLRVADAAGNLTGLLPFTVQVQNVAPSVAITSAPIVAPVGSSVALAGSFTDPGTNDSHSAAWQLDTLPSFGGTVGGSAAAGTVTGTTMPPAAGVYTVTLRVTDKDGGSGTATADSLVVIFDPSGGYVTGGGWIDSPAGACRLTAVCQGATGRASFGFVSKYRPGALTPSGQTEFHFQAGGLRFSSQSYEWLVVGGARAQFRGTGTVNGVGGYSFLLTAIDGQVNGGGGADRFRIKISGPGGLVYDNQAGAAEDSDAATAIAGGSIVVHKE